MVIRSHNRRVIYELKLGVLISTLGKLLVSEKVEAGRVGFERKDSS